MSGDLDGLQPFLEKLYRERGLDLRGYKATTLARRLGRRLRARGVSIYADYVLLLDHDPSEYDRLLDELTINVTSFFRDAVAFRALEEVALPSLTGRGTQCLRIWSAGCAAGEEAYSIAMLLLERLGGAINRWEVTILATDIDAKALACAREGVFSRAQVEGIPPQWREQYLAPEGRGFRVQPALRQLVVFKEHNLLSDPAYCDLDLVLCRNVLIYFTPDAQIRVLTGFYEGLNEGGFLLLGKPEATVGGAMGLFHCVDSRARLYRKAMCHGTAR